MDYKYRWKNGAPPSRDKAAESSHLLDESQFETKQDQELAEETVRKQMNIPVRIPDDEKSVLPHAVPPEQR